MKVESRDSVKLFRPEEITLMSVKHSLLINKKRKVLIIFTVLHYVTKVDCFCLS